MSDQEGKEWGGVSDKEWHEMSDEERSEAMAAMDRVEFAEMFFEAIDEEIADRYERTGGRFPDWERAVARAKLDGVVPLMGSGSRVMATIPHRGMVVDDCDACPFHVHHCLCSQFKFDTCGHPDAPPDLDLDGIIATPPVWCPLRKSTYHLVLDPELIGDGQEKDSPAES